MNVKEKQIQHVGSELIDFCGLHRSTQVQVKQLINRLAFNSPFGSQAKLKKVNKSIESFIIGKRFNDALDWKTK